jgi:ATP-dependent RNA helicase DDX60
LSRKFRQCAGRAGRRGYDLLGNVVFYGLPMDRIQRLMLSRLPVLSGSFPLTSTLCLRLFNLLHGSDHSDFAVKAVQSLFKLPRISFGSETGHSELLHHLRFSIDYLQRAGLLDSKGQPMNLFAVAAHLYHTDPSNLALVTLIRRGVLHVICSQKNLINAKYDFMLTMCHLFGRRYLPKAYANDKHLRDLRSRSPSRIVLPPLLPVVQEALVQHNAEILQIFSAYAFLYVSQHRALIGREDELPLSKVSIGHGATDCRSLFHRSIRETAIPLTSRSPFVANSGHSEQCATVRELVQTCRRDLHLNDHAIPSFDDIIAGVGKSNDSAQLNAYLLDFFIHGQVNPLVHANGIRRGDVWFVLQDFQLTLLTIRNALQQLLLRASERKDPDGLENVEDEDFYVDMPEVDELEEDSSRSFRRPGEVSEKDWRVYEVVDAVAEEFSEKFKKMWA